jgi:UDP-N-acetylglucosamine 2-epimerase
MANTRIVVLAGARPNFIKVAPILRELGRRAETYDVRLVHTGQHSDDTMSDVFLSELGIPTPTRTWAWARVRTASKRHGCSKRSKRTCSDK